MIAEAGEGVGTQSVGDNPVPESRTDQVTE